MESFLKVYLPIFFLMFIILIFVIPSIRVYKQTGINPFRFITKHDLTHDFLGITMKVFIVMLLLTILIYSAVDGAYRYLAPFIPLENFVLQVIGLILGHIGLFGIMLAQVHMKQSWRIGIDYEHKTRLVTTGLFGVSRNPIYLFLILSLSGLFLVIPNAITFAVLFAAYLILQVTMRMEEDFLLKQHGEEYRNYMKSVRRLI